MAETTREIVYYKGKPYYILEDKGQLVKLEDSTNTSITMLVYKDKVLTEEQFKNKPNSLCIINWIP